MPLADFLHTLKDVFSVIGVFATTGGIVWGIYKFRRERQTRVRVQVSAGFPAAGQLAFKDCVVVTAINDSDHPVRVVSAGLELPDKRTVVVAGQQFPGGLPTEIRPHDSARALFEVEPLEAEGLDVYAVIAFVQTSTEERFTSKPTALFSRPQAA